jgi:uncharacterized protein (DUF2147 family)
MHNYLKPVALLLAAALVSAAGQPAPSAEGNWLTEKKSAIVEVFRCWGGGDALCGKLVWFRIRPDDPNPQGLDLKNPDPAQRNRPLCGLMFMYGFKPGETGNWTDGTVYDPDGGHTYHATMMLQPDGTLRLHGYIGISLIGASEVWTRYTQPVPSCPAR